MFYYTDNLASSLSLLSDFISFCIFLLDIDECQNSSHGCNENATCVNTTGHFNCTCNPGYTRDGKTCSGKIFLPFIMQIHLVPFL